MNEGFLLHAISSHLAAILNKPIIIIFAWYSFAISRAWKAELPYDVGCANSFNQDHYMTLQLALDKHQLMNSRLQANFKTEKHDFHFRHWLELIQLLMGQQGDSSKL
jgi:hypothetical protein